MKLIYLPLVGKIANAYEHLQNRECGFYPTHFEINKYFGNYYLSLCGENNTGISEIIL